jgi:hypothetical protein
MAIAFFCPSIGYTFVDWCALLASLDKAIFTFRAGAAGEGFIAITLPYLLITAPGASQMATRTARGANDLSWEGPFPVGP